MAAIELGIPYYVYTPSQGSYFAVNAPADANFVGYVTEITGLDDSGVRENAQVIVAGDGGHHGPFWRDRRPWTMSGIILPIFPLLARDQSQEKLEGIVGEAMSSDGYLTWTPADGVQRMLKFRKQQPVRISTGQSKVEKTFQIAGVAADWRILSWIQHSQAVSGASPLTTPAIVNQGNAPAPCKFVVTGPVTGSLKILNNQTNKALTFVSGYAIGSGASLTIDLTGAYPSLLDSGANDRYGQIDPLNTDWSIAAESSLIVSGGSNTFTLTGTGTSGATGLTVYWNDAWK